MDRPDQHDYYLKRATASRELAQRAANPRIAAIHSELATRYDDVVFQLEQTDGIEGTAQAA